MDDYTWQKMLRQRRVRQRRRLYLLLLLIAAFIGTAIWYGFFYTRTPEYALKQLTIAMEQHDTERFQKYVNMDVLASRAYDDLTVDLFAYDSTLTADTKAMFEKFYILIKPQLSKGLEQAVLTRIDSGAWSLPEGTDILKGRQLGIDFERFLERSQLRNTTFVSLGNIEHSGGTVTAELNVLEDYTQTPFTLQLILE